MTSLGELLYALVEPVPDDAGEVYSLAAGGSLFELYGMDGHDDCGLSTYCRNPLHPGPCKGWKKHLGITAPGVLTALEKIRKEKLAVSRAKRAAAKAEAEKVVHHKLGHGSHPLFQKQLTLKHVHQALGNDENKAVQKAAKAILNKTEIKRYAKLKSAQIAANGGSWAGTKDQARFAKELEHKIIGALAADNQENTHTHLTDLLDETASDLAKQFADRQMPACAKGDHDCDGVAYEALKAHLATSVFRGLRDGNMDQANGMKGEVEGFGGNPEEIRAWLKKEGVDLESPEMEVTAPEPAANPPAKVGGPNFSTVKAAGLKPGTKVYLSVVSHDGKPYPATTKDAGNTHALLVTVDAPQGGKTVFHVDETGEKIIGGAAAKKYFLTEAEGHPLSFPKPGHKPTIEAETKAAKKVDQQLNAPDKVGEKLDEAFGPPPKAPIKTQVMHEVKSDPAMEVLTNQQLINGIKMHGTSSPKGQVMVAELKKRGLDPDGNPLPAMDDAAAQAAGQSFWMSKADSILTGDSTLSPDGKILVLSKLDKDTFDKLGITKQNQVLTALMHNHAETDNSKRKLMAEESYKKLTGLPMIALVKPNDVTPDEAAQGNAPKAAEWVQPDKHGGWISDGDMTDVLSGTYKPMAGAQEEDWLASVSYMPKSQFETLSPSAQGKILDKLKEIHQVDMDTGDLDHADQVDGIYGKLADKSIGVTFEPSPPMGAYPGEASPAEEIGQTIPVGNALKTALKIGVGNTEMLHLIKNYPQNYKDLDDGEKQQIKGILQAKYALGTPEESGEAQSLAILLKIDLADYGSAAPEVGAPAEMSENLKKIISYAHGDQWALAKTKLPLYQALTDDELASLAPEEKDLLIHDLQAMSLKFKDPKKVAATAEVLLKVHKAAGGGAGAGGTTHTVTPAAEELNSISPKAAILIADNVDKMMEAVKHITGIEYPEGAGTTIANNVAKMIQDGDDAKLLSAVNGPASAMAAWVGNNNDLLEPHKEDLKDALQQDLFKMLKSGVKQDTPVLDAVQKWGKTKSLKANAAAKIQAALASHTTQQGAPGHTKSDATIAHELASHAGEIGLPGLYDPSDYGVASKWIGAHALKNAMVDTGLDPGEIAHALGDDFATNILDDAEKQLQAEYLVAFFDGKTTPDGLAGKLPHLVQVTNEITANNASKSGWKEDSPAALASKAGTFAGLLKKEFAGKPSGEGGAATEVPSQVKNAVADALTTPGELTDGQKISLKQAYKSFGSTAYLKEATVEQNFDNLLAVASAYSGEEGMGKLTFGKVMDAIDEQMAQELGVVNGKLLRKKITDWLETPGGKGYADTASPKGQLLTQLTGKIAEQKEIAEWQKKNALPKYPGPGAFDPAKQASDFKSHTVASSKALHDKTLKAMGKTVSPAQKQAIVSYTGSGASYMNDWLRTGKSYGGINTIKEAHLVAEAMYPIAEDMKLLRRTGWEFVPPQYRSYEAIQKLIGGTFHDPAFMSTTVHGQPGSYGKGLPVELNIEAPKGTHGFHADHWSVFKGKENEFLLGAGQTMQIMGVKKIGSKVVIDVRVVTE